MTVICQSTVSIEYVGLDLVLVHIVPYKVLSLCTQVVPDRESVFNETAETQLGMQ